MTCTSNSAELNHHRDFKNVGQEVCGRSFLFKARAKMGNVAVDVEPLSL